MIATVTQYVEAAVRLQEVRGDGERVRARVGDGIEERLRERVRTSSSKLGQRQSVGGGSCRQRESRDGATPKA
jgi:hypothetical protein